ncbi:L10-interacting MYB domain-containing protein-like [Cucumis melo var. makuwa]|uniref:L10-interacting MYB domain-containing protein-like n=1 Tax=Cucumis melo var. makuwa TaxID=1194695 RepID=A0A5D3CIA3_CUCMM|nr:L10-interacting MYB domain-containing protein-like [Cucumis melo var. makuwa]
MVKPKATKFRAKGLQNADQLDILFKDIAVTGDRAWAPSQGFVPQSTEGNSSRHVEENDDTFEDMEHNDTNETEYSIHTAEDYTQGKGKKRKIIGSKGDELFMKAAYIFTKRENREMFVALQEPKIQVMSFDNYNIDSNDHFDESDVEYELDQLVELGCGAGVHHFVMHVCKEPCRTSSHTGYKFVMEILNGHEDRCHQQFRMEKHIFQKLLIVLEQQYNFSKAKRLPLEKTLAMFLITLSHSFSNRMVQERFQHSDPQFKTTSDKVKQDTRYWSYFKDCTGAIDVTHIQVLRRPHLGFSHPPKDSGYPQTKGYLGPYRGEQYHLADFRRGSQPKDMKEVKIVASMALHNFIRVHSKADFEFKPYDDDEILLPSNDEINYEDINEEHRGLFH